jgi:hypothetical protein
LRIWIAAVATDLVLEVLSFGQLPERLSEFCLGGHRSGVWQNVIDGFARERRSQHFHGHCRIPRFAILQDYHYFLLREWSTAFAQLTSFLFFSRDRRN